MDLQSVIDFTQDYTRKNYTSNSLGFTTDKQGGFVVGGWSGHAITLNKEGMINNVGAPREKNNIWDPQYALPKANKFYVLYPGKQNQKQ